MRKISLIILLLCTVQFSKGQEPQAKDFYVNLGKDIETLDSDSIILTTINYGCLGSKVNWSAKFKMIDNMVRIDFYSERPKDRTKILSELETVLDTTFTVEKSVFKKNFEAEITEIKSRPVLIEANFKISLNQGASIKEFTFRRGEGLYYLLRFNKTWTTYFAKK